MENTKPTFSNPRLHAIFNDWPMGGNKGGTCTFAIEHNVKRGYRVSRTTTGKPKYSTYSGYAAIVDGSDGKTYIIQRTKYGFINIYRSDFLLGGSIWPLDHEYLALIQLINQANQNR